MEPIVEGTPLEEWNDHDRINAVKRIFRSITPHYDLLNRILSARQDVKWRRFAAKRIPRDAARVLDVATGTGDLANAITSSHNRVEVIGVDFVESMIHVGRTKTASLALSDRVLYAAGDAMTLPFVNGEFDAATIAFGLRNIPDRSAALRELARVVRPGGKVITLEMTFPRRSRLAPLLRWYLNRVIPIVGGLISGDSNAYRYLPDSIQEFLDPVELSGILSRVGLQNVRAFPLMFGLTYLHEGTVP